ncbi:MAG: hypothetical protein R2991_15070 [Thermoanaerobaculia bacterium]
MPRQRETAILVEEARTHNLKGVSCRVPHGRVTVVTGPSGAGKSSLAFDTIYAEGQRRFVESMSTYARQFLEQMERPPVEALHNILPAVALEARNPVRNARSTVGTLTEVRDVLRLLFTHLGEVSCPAGHGPARSSARRRRRMRCSTGGGGERSCSSHRSRASKRANDALKELVRQEVRPPARGRGDRAPRRVAPRAEAAGSPAPGARTLHPGDRPIAARRDARGGLSTGRGSRRGPG